MTDEQINHAIAEACGISGNTYKLCLKTGNYEQSPNFCNDLNAMHEAENVLTDDKYVIFSNYLYDGECEKQKQTKQWRWLSATARQRAEAFLRTLGKWEDGK